MLRLVVLVEGEGATRRVRSLVLLRADAWSEARERALLRGHEMERSYVGGTGERVRWRLEGIETLDLLGEAIEDGREVYAEPVDLAAGESMDFDTVFHPDASEPGQAGV